MTTPNEELRKLADEAQPSPMGNMATRQQQSDYLCAKMAAHTAFQSVANPAKVIELLDRIDRLEAEKNHYQEQWSEVCNENQGLLNKNEAKDRLLREAEAWLIPGACNALKAAITQHLKGTP